jgi:enterochelin esterase-like enzyme
MPVPLLGTFHDLGPQPVLGLGERRVRVYVPDDLPGPRSTLVLFDGQNVFDDDGSFAGGWHAHLAVQKLGRRRCQVPVIVAVDNGGLARLDELGPWRTGEHGGKADLLLDWLVGTLMPDVRARFGLSPAAASTAIGGSSMGGLAALYAHFRHPQEFGLALAMSPSLWFAGRRMLSWIEQQPRPPASRIYLDCGGREGPKMMPNAEWLAHRLRRRGWGQDALWWRIEARGRHNEKAWRRRLPGALRFLFRKA